jgi:hypothetical protein
LQKLSDFSLSIMGSVTSLNAISPLINDRPVFYRERAA